MRYGIERVAALTAIGLLAACAGTSHRPAPGIAKIGRPYTVRGITYRPRDDPYYDEVGLASWYGDEHRGARTANGERFDPGGISAAHRTLPMPSWVEVTVLATGRRLVVRINDRGPFAGGRIIDLSYGAAKRLGIDRGPPVRVRVRRVGN